MTFNIDIQHHHHEKEQHHHCTDIDQHQRQRQEIQLSATSRSLMPEKGQYQKQHGMYRVARRNYTKRGKQQHRRKQIKQTGRDTHIQILSYDGSAVFGIRQLVGSNFRLESIPHSQQHFLSEVEIPAFFTVVFQNVSQRWNPPDNSLHRNRKKCTWSNQCHIAWSA
jgi:hypothetical protein